MEEIDPYDQLIIQYEEILLPEDLEPEDSSSSGSEDDVTDTESKPGFSKEDQTHAEEIKAETTDILLDFVVPPRKFERDGKQYLLRLSRKPATRDDVVNLSRAFEDYLEQRQARLKGFCPIRRELYDFLFDELIRQTTLACMERGSLLLRIRDEFRMTLAAYEKLFENGIEYGSRKALESELELQNLKLKHQQLEQEARAAERRVRDLEKEVEQEQILSKQKIDLRMKKHEENMNFLRKANEQLKQHLSTV